MTSESHAADVYFNELISRVDRVIGEDARILKPPIHIQILSEHSLTSTCTGCCPLRCNATYDHLSVPKRRYLFVFSLALQAMMTGVYTFFLNEGVADFSQGGGWCLITIMYQSAYWLVRSGLRRPDMTGFGDEKWVWFTAFLSFCTLMFTIWSWVFISDKKVIPLAVHLLWIIYYTQWLVELIILVICMKTESRCLITIGDEAEYMKQNGLADDIFIENYIPPDNIDNEIPSVMPSTIDI